jgi:hypothetical protein
MGDKKIKIVREERVAEVLQCLQDFNTKYHDTNMAALYMHLKSTRTFFKLSNYEKESIWDKINISHELDKVKSTGFISGAQEMKELILKDKAKDMLITTNNFVDGPVIDVKFNSEKDKTDKPKKSKKAKGKVLETIDSEDPIEVFSINDNRFVNKSVTPETFDESVKLDQKNSSDESGDLESTVSNLLLPVHKFARPKRFFKGLDDSLSAVSHIIN